MSHETISAYGLWSLVIINSAVFIIFAYSFSKPESARDWRSFSAFSAFIVALFTEMYGAPHFGVLHVRSETRSASLACAMNSTRRSRLAGSRIWAGTGPRPQATAPDKQSRPEWALGGEALHAHS
jgi:hypothetical protein